MTRILLLLAAGLVLLGIAAIPASAATPAIATTDVNMRAGPATAYPVVTVIPRGARVVTHGCVADFSWCDVAWAGKRGWVHARYVQIVWRGAPVVVTPAVAAQAGVVVVTYDRAYWDTWYVGYPWYGRWTYYPPHVAPRVTSHSRTVDCGNGSCTAIRSTTGIHGGSSTHVRSCANGECTATRTAVGPHGGTATRTRNCSRADASCTVSRTRSGGGTVSRTRVWSR
ncbi:SH3 domain-containing protein [Oricola thermophila]|uniref:SH3 domain-containing protein n=1 Tax=Oricola thermophila TaxID=2742145 RepID=A0A6N1V9F7_9HYPH|nr:SH3 domain-containing protein [Oricola thermophila]QKV17560.1 SH3 domain-containing protein [Oricola thermophila]